MASKKMGNCIACKRPLEWTNWAAGPVCYPCYWGAKLLYENGISEIKQLHEYPGIEKMLSDIFEKNGYTYPDELIQAWKDRHFDKANTGARRWWSPTPEQEENDLKGIQPTPAKIDKPKKNNLQPNMF